MGTERDFVVKKGLKVAEDIELGHASDTTIARASAGVISVEGVAVPTISSASTLTNKTIAISQVTELSNLTAVEGAQLENIGSTTISATQWGYLGAASGAITNTDTQLSTEQVQDIVGAMFGSNTETRISATYQDGDGTIDLVVDDMVSLVSDSTPQLGGDLDTNGHDIIIDDGKGIYASAISNGLELMLFQHTASANSYIQVWNGIADSAAGTLFGNDVVHTDTVNIGRIVGPGFEATGSTTDVGMSFRAKGLGQFSFFQDDISASGAPVVNLIRYVDDDSSTNGVADDDILGQIKWMGGQSTMASPFLHDLRTYARIEANLVDTTTNTTDGNLMLSAMCANTHTDFLEIGTNKTNDTSAGVRAYTGSMVTVSGTGTTALDRDTHAGAYVRATGAGTFTLWDNPKVGDQVVVISDHGGTTTIDGYSNDTINGSANTTITTQYNAKTFIATSTTTWIALG